MASSRFSDIFVICVAVGIAAQADFAAFSRLKPIYIPDSNHLSYDPIDSPYSFLLIMYRTA